MTEEGVSDPRKSFYAINDLSYIGFIRRKETQWRVKLILSGANKFHFPAPKEQELRTVFNAMSLEKAKSAKSLIKK